MNQEQNSRNAGWRVLLGDLLDQPASLPESCAAVLTSLDLYVSDELEGVDVRARHPAFWAHLQGCSECRAEYLELRDLLQAESDGAVAAFAAGGLESPSQSPGPVDVWRLAIEPIAGRREPALQFIFAPVYLRQSLRGDSGAYRARAVPRSRVYESPLSGEDDREGGVLLLSYLGDTPGGEMIVTLRAQPEEAGELALLLLQVVGDFSLRLAQLMWAGQRWQAEIGPDGYARLGPVPLAILDQAPPGAGAFALRLVP
jgi:hypothetical protein